MGPQKRRSSLVSVKSIISANTATLHSGCQKSRNDYQSCTRTKFDSQTAFEIVSIDIAKSAIVGENIGSRLQVDQAEADTREARAKGSERRAEAIAVEQEQKVKWSVIRPTIQAEAEAPKAMAAAFRTGNIDTKGDKTMHSRRSFLTICIPLVLMAMTQADDITENQQNSLKTFRGEFVKITRAKESFQSPLKWEVIQQLNLQYTKSLSITRSRSLNTKFLRRISGKLSWQNPSHKGPT